jgi:gamma-glutamyl hercynylcysteine S-oxide synthase
MLAFIRCSSRSTISLHSVRYGAMRSLSTTSTPTVMNIDSFVDQYWIRLKDDKVFAPWSSSNEYEAEVNALIRSVRDGRADAQILSALDEKLQALQSHYFTHHFASWAAYEFRVRNHIYNANTNLIFSLLKNEDMLFSRPLQLRQPFIFYKGHIPAFSWIMFRKGFPQLKTDYVNQDLEKLFERGIDPSLRSGEVHENSVDKYKQEKGIKSDSDDLWPTLQEVIFFVDAVYSKIDMNLDRVLQSAEETSAKQEALHILQLVLEHECLHQETLMYIMRTLPLDHIHKQRSEPFRSLLPTYSTGSVPSTVSDTEFVALRNEGEVDIGRPRFNLPAAIGRLPCDHLTQFGWDLEYGTTVVDTDKNTEVIGKYPVTCGQFLEFVKDGGYAKQHYWNDDHWTYIRQEQRDAPISWFKSNSEDEYTVRYILRELPLSNIFDHPVSCTLAEAMAYCKWWQEHQSTMDNVATELKRVGIATDQPMRVGVPNENQWSRAVGYSSNTRGNNINGMYADLKKLHVDNIKEGGVLEPVAIDRNDTRQVAASGVSHLVGNAWEWTSSTLAPFEGYEIEKTYPNYSVDFFDQEHFVLRGGSFLTSYLRPQFRNFYQDIYAYVPTQFRLAVTQERV